MDITALVNVVAGNVHTATNWTYFLSPTRANWDSAFFLYLYTGLFVGLGFAIWYMAEHYRASHIKHLPKDAPKPGVIPSADKRWNKAIWLIFILFVMIMFYSLYVHTQPNDSNIRSPTAKVQAQASHPALNVTVYGQQWQWSFYLNNYTNHTFNLYEFNQVELPTNTVIWFNVTSRDVMHDFAIPTLSVKADAYPGHFNRVWTYTNNTGNVSAFCMEYCGVGHFDMRAQINFVPYHTWLNWAEQNTNATLEGSRGH